MATLPYAIGGIRFPGLSKLIEEAGEVLQVAGKIIATGGKTEHWDGSDLDERLYQELADLLAAIGFVIEVNGLDDESIDYRRQSKLALFHAWHEETVAGRVSGTPDYV